MCAHITTNHKVEINNIVKNEKEARRVGSGRKRKELIDPEGGENEVKYRGPVKPKLSRGTQADALIHEAEKGFLTWTVTNRGLLSNWDTTQ